MASRFLSRGKGEDEDWQPLQLVSSVSWDHVLVKSSDTSEAVHSNKQRAGGAVDVSSQFSPAEHDQLSL